MRLNFETIRANPQRLISLTGFRKNEFEELLSVFEQEWDFYNEHYTFEGKLRIRKSYIKSNSVLPKGEDKLFFVLFYYKQYPIQELMGANFNMTQPQVNDWLKLLGVILKRALKKLAVLPARNGKRISELLKEIEVVIIDGVERAILRPKDNEEQKEYYSGKKRVILSRTTL
jgi:Helix-turn-helix of DDE superfamily endonuclease